MSREARFLSPLDRILYLRSLWSWADLPMAVLVELATVATERFAPAGEVVVRAGEPIRAAYLVVEGRVEVTWDGYSEVVEQGGGLNWLRLLSRAEGAREARAVADTVLLEIPAVQYLDILESHWSLLESLVRGYTGLTLELRDRLPQRPEEAKPAELGQRPAGQLGIVERLDVVLAAGIVWAEANLEAVVTIAQSLEQVEYPAGTTMWSAGDSAPAGLFLLYGKVHCTADDGRSVDVGAGFGLGFFDAVAAVPRAYSAVAITDVVGLEWDMATVFGVLEHQVDTAMAMLASTTGLLSATWDARVVARTDAEREAAMAEAS